MKESKTPGKKKVGRATVPGGSEQSWRWVTVPSVAHAVSEALAQLLSRGARSVNPGEALAPAPWETRLCPVGAGAAPEPTHSRRSRKGLQTTAQKSAALSRRVLGDNEGERHIWEQE